MGKTADNNWKTLARPPGLISWCHLKIAFSSTENLDVRENSFAEAFSGDIVIVVFTW